jgi:hypothetical protein
MTRLILFVVAALLVAAGPADAKDVPCATPIEVKETPPPILSIKGKCTVPTSATPYKYNVINILDGGELIFDDANGTIDFWAQAIIIENGGKLTIGTPTAPIGTKDPKTAVTIHLYGPTTAPGAAGVPCNSSTGGGKATCGAPTALWESNVDANHKPKPPTECAKGAVDVSNCVRRVQAVCDALPDGPAKVACNNYPGPKDDFFYAYHPLFHDDGDMNAYFGNKTIGVGYGGSLQLFGKKGAIYNANDAACKPTSADSTGRSWTRLAKTANKDAQSITVAIPNWDTGTKIGCGLEWAEGDIIVITTTDYLPGHSEQRKITGTPTDNGDGTITIGLDSKLAYHHYGEQYQIPQAAVDAVGLSITTAETRAAVGLLSRNIRIVSGGAEFGQDLPAETSAECTGSDGPSTNKCYFGGHVVIRQGFTQVQIQGAEFYQLGQGARLGHYAIHFHHARRTPPSTYVLDSSIWDSMTRWIVLHGTQDVTLARNVGYKSIGHGFYLEDGTEINNSLLGNLGVFARAAVENTTQNPRKVPGILAAPDLNDNFAEHLPFTSDTDHPTVFWFMNTWNDVQYNQAAGAGTCGVCFWLVPGYNSTISRDLKWDSYASMQSKLGRAAMTPVKSFIGNACTTAMTSLQTVGETAPCLGVGGPVEGTQPYIKKIKNDLAYKWEESPKVLNPKLLDYYPGVDTGGGRFATRCDGANADCSADASPKRCGEGQAEACQVTVIDRYTTSFNWAAFNFAAIWLRPQWYLMTDSVVTDVQGAGLTMVTGGGYTASDAPTGHWAVVRKSAFVGHTQPTKNVNGDKEPVILMPDNRYAADGGPFNPYSGLRCGEDTTGNRPGNRCVSIDEGVAFPVNAFGMYQRLFSVYDGPAYQESNAYLGITRRKIDDCTPFYDSANNVGRCDSTDKDHRQSAWLAGFVPGLAKGYDKPATEEGPFCFMPNAAIGWKQPNGFYYPPAFHSSNLYFGPDVDIRHFVISPPFKEGTLEVDFARVNKNTCIFTGTNENNKKAPTTFTGFAGNDRQTVLNDDDGTMTGYKGTTVINLDDFFAAPVEAIQCQSENSSRSSPYEYVSTVIYPKCRADGKCAAVDSAGNPILNDGLWNRSCTDEACYGIPLWRQDLMPEADKDPPKTGTAKPRSLRMMGQNTSQRGSLTVNHGTYYFDTSVGQTKQLVCNAIDGKCPINVFKATDTYYLFTLFAKKGFEQTYRFYVGPTNASTPDHPLDFMTIKLLQANISTDPPTYPRILDIPRTRVKWKGPNDDPTKDKLTGVVEVVLNAGDVVADWDAAVKTAKKAKCQPDLYCGPYDEATGVCPDKTPPLPAGANACKWAVVEPLDCPAGGCIGFLFTMPATFATDPATDPLPPALCVTKTADSPFNVNLDARKVVSGVCPRDADKLLDDFCK